MDDSFKLRRQIAVASFIHVLLIVHVSFAMVWFGDEAISAKLGAASPILMMIVTALIANISHYMHLVHKSDEVGPKE